MENRIRKLIKHYSDNSIIRFENAIGVEKGSIKAFLLHEVKALPYDSLIKLLKRFREVNARWLLYGEGGDSNMLESDSKFEEDSEDTTDEICNAWELSQRLSSELVSKNEQLESILKRKSL